MAYKRGCRIDTLKNGNYRLILFGHFSHGFQSQEIDDIPEIDLKDIFNKIGGVLYPPSKEGEEAHADSKL